MTLILAFYNIFLMIKLSLRKKTTRESAFLISLYWGYIWLIWLTTVNINLDYLTGIYQFFCSKDFLHSPLPRCALCKEVRMSSQQFCSGEFISATWEGREGSCKLFAILLHERFICSPLSFTHLFNSIIYLREYRFQCLVTYWRICLLHLGFRDYG
jgi:hypothetical protein